MNNLSSFLTKCLSDVRVVAHLVLSYIDVLNQINLGAQMEQAGPNHVVVFESASLAKVFRVCDGILLGSIDQSRFSKPAEKTPCQRVHCRTATHFLIFCREWVDFDTSTLTYISLGCVPQFENLHPLTMIENTNLLLVKQRQQEASWSGCGSHTAVSQMSGNLTLLHTILCPSTISPSHYAANEWLLVQSDRCDVHRWSHRVANFAGNMECLSVVNDADTVKCVGQEHVAFIQNGILKCLYNFNTRKKTQWFIGAKVLASNDCWLLVIDNNSLHHIDITSSTPWKYRGQWPQDKIEVASLSADFCCVAVDTDVMIWRTNVSSRYNMYEHESRVTALKILDSAVLWVWLEDGDLLLYQL